MNLFSKIWKLTLSTIYNIHSDLLKYLIIYNLGEKNYLKNQEYINFLKTLQLIRLLSREKKLMLIIE